MLTSTQMEAYDAFVAEFGDDVYAPRQLADSVGVNALIMGRKLVPSDNAFTELIDCPCGRDHTPYQVVLPDGTVIPTADEYIISGTMGELFTGLGDVWDRAEPIAPEDWPSSEAFKVEIDDLNA